jgi:uncharacterized heparinase superfamily protein
MTHLRQAALLARTVRQLPMSQVAHRVRLRTQRAVLKPAVLTRPAFTAGAPDAPPGWPAGFAPLDTLVTSAWPPVELLVADRIRLLGREAPIGDWSAANLPRLWRFHLHYWDWAWPLLCSADTSARRVYLRLLDSWRRATGFGRGDAWAPYVASLRAWSWCGQFSHLDPADRTPDLAGLLWSHAQYLRTHLELDVGGNHLVKNLKALAGLGVYFGSARLVGAALRRLQQQVGRQILADGGHYERAPAYHCQVLGDLVDVADLLAAAGHPVPHWLTAAVARMRWFLGHILLPDGTVPLWGDGFPVPMELLAALRPERPAWQRVTLLESTGLAVLRAGRLFVLADVGDPCPRELPAHAHADTLSFLLYDGRRRVVSEVGTSTYAAGARRAFERSTAAHSTVVLDGADSTEVWGAFRAARRAAARVVRCVDSGGTVLLTAEHDGYRRLPGAPVHRRTWTLSPRRLTVHDEIDGAWRHDVAVRLVLDPDARAEDVARFHPGWHARPIEVADGWHRLRRGRVLCRSATVTLPWSHVFHYVIENPENHEAGDSATRPEAAP